MQTTLTIPPAARTPRKISRMSRPAPPGRDFPRRREFLALPMAKRRGILQHQASAARGYYARTSEWREWEAADLTSRQHE
jgi:hypothetical protein